MTELVLRNKEIIKKLDYVKDTVYSSKAMDSEYVKSKLIYHKGFEQFIGFFTIEIVRVFSIFLMTYFNFLLLLI